MKDTDLRGLVLTHFYQNRRSGYYKPSALEVGAPAEVTDSDILHICGQLGEHNLIEWKSLATYGVPIDGKGKINAFGIDVIEGEAKSPISIHLDNSQTISVSGSSNVNISGSNTQANTITLQDLIKYVKEYDASEAERSEVKNILKKLLEHPMLTSIAGGLAGLLG